MESHHFKKSVNIIVETSYIFCEDYRTQGQLIRDIDLSF